ncbi:MAG: cyclic pyranopterin monophosphate synthase MoaC [Planctomycetota bacterium]
MVEVGDKEITKRTAVASAVVRTKPEVLKKIKRTPELIPLCHPLTITSASVDFETGKDHVRILATVKARDRTGVEMEALTAAAVAALTLYDMCKAADRAMVIEAVRLEEKSGGKSGHYKRAK